MHASCKASIARLDIEEMDKPRSGENSELADWLSNMCLEYEDRMLHLQDQPAHGGAGLLAIGDRLEAFIEYKAACLDDELLALIKAYLANVRRVVGAN